ncbi:MFS transporter [Sphingomonas sp.]|jgi:MFS family permease|uniref:MFS transporter n=1 Tax=Sphingomonas sp. TaxID=28214 RepID=UPI002D80E2B9|nr:MFS transporter [Sphingomonas sp.]HEU0044036.1 MFS transporter [Sphingomonas sp.]
MTAAAQPSPGQIRQVITASSLGTVFEWYDFFIWGTLTASGILQRSFFPPGDELLATLLAWATFAVGFAFRPLGAIVFGYLGDKLGRKYTFLVTITLMGVATAGIGLVPSYATIGTAAPVTIILLRIAQGLALGGEYGGAAIYVAEHSPARKSGFYTSFIQASVVGGFILSLAVVLFFKGLVSGEAWIAWGWRLPFLFSILLLAVSLWMRFKLAESPVFKAMKAEGETAGNPFVESFTYPGNLKRLFVALFGIGAGLTVIFYTAMFSALAFMQGPLRIDETTAQVIAAAGAFAGLPFYFWTGAWSDRVGRRKPILIGYALTLVLLFPLFWLMGWAGAGAAAPGFVPDAGKIGLILVAIVGLMALSGLTYGSVAALLAEMFPARIRYSSMSIPYHFGTGYFGGFLPLISAYVVSRTGDPYSGLWYTWAVVLMALVVTWWGLEEPAREGARAGG